jgi:hypothetical protein
MGWTSWDRTNPSGYSVQRSGQLTSTYSVGWPFWTKNDTAVWKFFDIADDLEITLSLYNDEQSNTAPFDSVTFTVSAQSQPTYWQYTGFPTRGDGNPKDNFRYDIAVTKLTNNSRRCADYQLLVPA